MSLCPSCWINLGISHAVDGNTGATAMSDPDVVVIGGGPAGAGAARLLAQVGPLRCGC